RGACGGHNSRTRLLATPAPPTPPPTAASAAPCEALPFSPGQAAQLAAQVLQRIGPHRLALAPEHCEADRPVERGQIARLQPPSRASTSAARAASASSGGNGLGRGSTSRSSRNPKKPTVRTRIRPSYRRWRSKTTVGAPRRA